MGAERKRTSSTTFYSPVNFSLSLTELKQSYKLPNHETVHGLLEWEPDPFILISEWEPGATVTNETKMEESCMVPLTQ